MTFKKVVIPVVAVAALMAAGGEVQQAAAAADQPAAQDAVVAAAKPKNGAEDGILKLSQNGWSAMRDVRAARVAIFNGKPEMATNLLDKAKASLDQAEKEAPTFAVKTVISMKGQPAESESKSGTVDLIPIDSQLALADSFVPTPEKEAHIKKANEHLKSGDTDKALKELKDGEIDVSYMRVLMPIKSTANKVDQAIALNKEQKYYEANLALKAAEDGLVIDTVDMADMPQTVTN